MKNIYMYINISLQCKIVKNINIIMCENRETWEYQNKKKLQILS